MIKQSVRKKTRNTNKKRRSWKTYENKFDHMDSPGIVSVPRNAVISFPPALMVRTSSSSRIVDLLLPTEVIVSNALRFGMFLPFGFYNRRCFVISLLNFYLTRYNLVHFVCTRWIKKCSTVTVCFVCLTAGIGRGKILLSVHSQNYCNDICYLFLLQLS